MFPKYNTYKFTSSCTVSESKQMICFDFYLVVFALIYKFKVDKKPINMLEVSRLKRRNIILIVLILESRV